MIYFDNRDSKVEIKTRLCICVGVSVFDKPRGSDHYDHCCMCNSSISSCLFLVTWVPVFSFGHLATFSRDIFLLWPMASSMICRTCTDNTWRRTDAPYRIPDRMSDRMSEDIDRMPERMSD